MLLFATNISHLLWKLSRKQKPQHIPKTVRPGILVMDGPRNLHIRKVHPALPPAIQQETLQHIRIAEMPRPLSGSHIQPDPQLRLRGLLRDRIKNTAVVPPERR